MAFNFTSLISKYYQPVVLRKKASGTASPGGKYTPGTLTEYNINVALIPFTDSEIQEYEGGKYTKEDRNIFTPWDLIGINKSTLQYMPVRVDKGDILVTSVGEEFIIDTESMVCRDYSNIRKYVGKVNLKKNSSGGAGQ